MALRRRVSGRARLPEVPGGPPPEDDVVELGDALAATLGAVAAAARRLGESGVSIGLGEHPLEIRLQGEIVAFSPETQEIRLRVGPARRSSTGGGGAS